MTQQLAAEIAIQAIFYTSVLFVAAVSAFWPWWRSQLGVTIIAKTLCLTVAVFPAMLTYWSGYHPPHWVSYAAIYALWLIPPILVWRAVVLWQVQRRVLAGAEEEVR